MSASARRHPRAAVPRRCAGIGTALGAVVLAPGVLVLTAPPVAALPVAAVAPAITAAASTSPPTSPAASVTGDPTGGPALDPVALVSDFEDGVPDAWVPAGGTALTLDDGSAAAGSASLRVGGLTRPGQGVRALVPADALRPGGYLEYDLAVTLAPGAEPTAITVRLGDLHTQTVPVSASGWVRVSGLVPYPEDATTTGTTGTSSAPSGPSFDPAVVQLSVTVAGPCEAVDAVPTAFLVDDVRLGGSTRVTGPVAAAGAPLPDPDTCPTPKDPPPTTTAATPSVSTPSVSTTSGPTNTISTASVSTSTVSTITGPTGSATTVDPGRSCTAAYRVTGQWPGGFEAEVAVTAGERRISGWTLTWTFPDGQAVTRAWGAVTTVSGSTVIASEAAWNGSLAAGEVARWGFIGSRQDRNGAPRVACTAW